MSDINIFTATGRLGADPEQRAFQNGDTIVNMRIAVSDAWRDKNTGEKRERTLWLPVKVSNTGLQTVALNYLKKGARVAVSGRLEQRSYEKDGIERQVTELVLGPFNASLVMLDSPSDKASGSGADEYREASGGGAQRTMAEELDDEVPF